MVLLLSLVILFGVTGTFSVESVDTPLIVAVTANGPEVTDQVAPRFGRSSHFTIVDIRSNHAKSVVRRDPNHTGYDMATELVKFKANVVITGRIGPNAHEVLRGAKIKVIQGVSGTVEEALNQFKAGELD